MKLSHKIITIMLPVFSTVCIAEEKKEGVWFDNNTIHYSGELSQELNEKLFQIYNSRKGSVKVISVESQGGEINLGLSLGNFIFDKKLNVKVSSYCLSSCANYVFTAGAIKYVEGDAVIAFHGGASSQTFNMSFLDKLTESEKLKAKAQIKNYLSEAIIREKEFFVKTGVQQKITTYGHSKKYPEYVEGKYSGWYFSEVDLNKLGVQNVVVNAPTWEPRQLSDDVKFLKVEVSGI